MSMQKDTAIFDLIQEEENRQRNGIELIASENFTSPAVMEATGSVLTNKYAEGYPASDITVAAKWSTKWNNWPLIGRKNCWCGLRKCATALRLSSQHSRFSRLH